MSSSGNNSGIGKIRRIIQIEDGKVYIDCVTKLGLIERDLYRSNSFYKHAYEYEFKGMTCVIINLQGNKKVDKDINRINSFSWWINDSVPNGFSYIETVAGVKRFIGVFYPDCLITVLEGRVIETDLSKFLFCQSYQDYCFLIRAEKISSFYIPIWIRNNFRKIIDSAQVVFDSSKEQESNIYPEIIPYDSTTFIYRMDSWVERKLGALVLGCPCCSAIPEDTYTGWLGDLIHSFQFHWIANTMCNGRNLSLFYFDGISASISHCFKEVKFYRGFYILSTPIKVKK